jgi:hypothetical protein
MFWLHVPLQTIRGEWLQAQGYERFTVLGHSAQLIDITLGPADPSTSATIGVVRQALRFDPMPEAEARQLFDQLRSRLPVLAFRRNAAICVPETELRVALADHKGNHPFRVPTLIPADLTPEPYDAVMTSTAYDDAATTLRTLEICPVVSDERLLAAMDLLVAAKYETLLRSVFLTHLTIIDSLANRSNRPSRVTDWIEKKIKEAKRFDDPSLESAVGNLKQTSHGSAIRELVGRAEKALGGDTKEIRRQQSRARNLYKLRSGLSHGADAQPVSSRDVADARTLIGRIVDAALEYPDVLTRSDELAPPSRLPAWLRRLLRFLSERFARLAA